MRRHPPFLLLIAISLVAAVGAGEAALRLYDRAKGVTPPYTHNLPECLAIPNGYFNYDLQPSLKVIYDSHNPRAITINRWGFRGPEYDPVKPAGVSRIFCFGGSAAFDPYVPDEKA